MKRTVAIVLAIISLLATTLSAGAVEVMCGASIDPYLESLTNEELKAIALADPTLTAEQIAEIELKFKILEPGYTVPTPRNVMVNLNMTPKMQEQNNWCAAATAQQTLIYFNGSAPAQSTIVQSVPAGCAAESVLNYVNARQSTNSYMRMNVPTRAGFDNAVNFNVGQRRIPIIFTFKVMASQVASGLYRYPTDGHYTNLGGQSYNDLYLVVDPYYFPKYVSSYPNSNGLLWYDTGALWTIHQQHTTSLFY